MYLICTKAPPLIDRTLFIVNRSQTLINHITYQTDERERHQYIKYSLLFMIIYMYLKYVMTGSIINLRIMLFPLFYK